MTNPFIWDGTFLGTINDTNINKKYAVGDREYWDITINSFRIVCLIKRVKDCTSCIIDELKPLFGLEKMGSHHIKYRNNFIILYRSRLTENGKEVVYEHSLNDLHLKDVLHIDNTILNKIRKIYVFRDLLKIGKTNDNNIIIRHSPSGVIYPISYNESALKLEKITNFSTPSTIPEVCHKKWFRNDKYDKIFNINILLCSMLNLFYKDKIQIILSKLRKDIVSVCERIMPGTYTHMADIISRILIPRLSTIPVDSSGKLLISQEDYGDDDYDEDGEAVAYFNPEPEEMTPKIKIDISKISV